MLDKFDNCFHLFDDVAHATNHGRTAVVSIKKVTKIEDGKIYLDNSPVAIKRPDKLINLTAYYFRN